MTLNGLDISTYQSTTPPLGGFAFLFARATYDLSPDTRYAHHMAVAKAAGIIRGAYHFGTGASTAAAQASAFLHTAGDAQILALDLESDAHSMSSAQAAQFIAAVRAADPLHRKIGLYHSLSGFPSGLGQDFNWVAAWQAAAPVVPWAFWQHTSSGSVSGYSGRLDLDTFAGDLAALRKLAGIAVAPPDPVTRYTVAIRKRTSLFDRPGGTQTGSVSRATYTTTRTATAPWWYRVTGPSRSKNIGRWFPAEPWMKVEVIP